MSVFNLSALATLLLLLPEGRKVSLPEPSVVSRGQVRRVLYNEGPFGEREAESRESSISENGAFGPLVLLLFCVCVCVVCVCVCVCVCVGINDSSNS